MRHRGRQDNDENTDDSAAASNKSRIPAPNVANRRSLLWKLAVVVAVVSCVSLVQVGVRPSLVLYTDTVWMLPVHFSRVVFYLFSKRSASVLEIPEKKAEQLISSAHTSSRLFGKPETALSRGYEGDDIFGTCRSNISETPGSERIDIKRPKRTGSSEWQAWVEKVGTSKAKFNTIQHASYTTQEFPAFFSLTPCGIHQVQTAQVGDTGFAVSKGGALGTGTAFAVQMDQEDNLDHAMRAGVMMCSYLLKRRLELLKAPLPLTFFVWWRDEPPGSAQFKIDLLQTFGKVFHITSGAQSQKISKKYEQVFSAPWNNRDSVWHDYSLSQGPIQMAMGESSLRLSMASIFVNRKPLEMYTGFSATVRKGLGIAGRSETSGGVIIFRRDLYNNPGDFSHEAHERSKQRLLVDARTGRRDTLMHTLCRTGLHILEADFHNKAKINTLREQVNIMANAAVAVGSHGSGLWNSVWMKPGSVTIEVTLRPGHCCFPIPQKYWGETDDVCTSPCRPYTMVNIADGVMAAGVRWFYFDPEYIDQPSGDSNRATTRVHVDAEKLAKVILGAHRLACGDNG
mmetsp:Transcript_4502/g.8190  ORF Transcript_4502/g.8190 Transcript_4502/m.8190 type:complete len:569 (+) Transcript_4502:258-1964(+)